MSLMLTLTMQSQRNKPMSDKKYKVIVSDRSKRMLGTHIRFMAPVNKDAAKAKKKELKHHYAILSLSCKSNSASSSSVIFFSCTISLSSNHSFHKSYLSISSIMAI